MPERRRQLLLAALVILLTAVMYGVWPRPTYEPRAAANVRRAATGAYIDRAAVKAPDVTIEAFGVERPQPEAPTPAAPSAVTVAGFGSAQVILSPPGTAFRVGGGPYTVPISVTDASRHSTISLTLTFDPALLSVRICSKGASCVVRRRQRDVHAAGERWPHRHDDRPHDRRNRDGPAERGVVRRCGSGAHDADTERRGDGSRWNTDGLAVPACDHHDSVTERQELEV